MVRGEWSFLEIVNGTHRSSFSKVEVVSPAGGLVGIAMEMGASDGICVFDPEVFDPEVFDPL